ncbi:MAG: hypothetical protein AB1640_24055 [bacterium]
MTDETMTASEAAGMISSGMHLGLGSGAASNVLSMVVKRIILFTMTHTRQLFARRVDFVNATAMDASIPWRRGVLSHVVTPMAVMRFDTERERLTLSETFPHVTPQDVALRTGFDLDIQGRDVPEILPATESELTTLRGKVRERPARVYPLFCDRIWGAPRCEP